MKPLHAVELQKGKLMDAAQATPGMTTTKISTEKDGRGWFGTSVGAQKKTTYATSPSAATPLGPQAPAAPRKGFSFTDAQVKTARTLKDFDLLSAHAGKLSDVAHTMQGPMAATAHSRARDAHAQLAVSLNGLGTEPALDRAVHHAMAAQHHAKFAAANA